MKLKIFNPIALLLAGMLTISAAGRAQQSPAAPVAPEPPASLNIDADVKLNINKELNLNLDKLDASLNDLQVNLNKDLNISLKNDISNKINMQLDALNMQIKNIDIEPKLDLHLDSIGAAIDKSLEDMHIDMNIDREVDENINDIKVDPQVEINSEDQADDNAGSHQSVEKNKTYSKSYPADGNDQLSISNTYGSVTVNTWNRNEFKVEVNIKVETGSDKDADKLLSAVTIDDNKQGNIVSFRTNYDGDLMNKTSRLWDAAFSGSRTRKLEINYTVYMPSRNALSVRNKYGNTELPDLDGKVTADCAYGSLKAGRLNGGDNDIKVRYGSANINEVNSSDVDMAYGSLEIGKADKLNANFRYGSAKIGRLTSVGNISVKYGSPLVITDLDRNFKSLSVNCEYSGVKLGLSGDESADFDVTVKNGSFHYGGSVNVTSKNPPDTDHGWRPTVNYKGHVGKGNGDKMITITSSLGSVNFD